MNKATWKLTIDYLLIMLGAAVIAYCGVMVSLKAMGYIDPAKALTEAPVAPQYTREEPFAGYIDANETTVVLQPAYLNSEEEWETIGPEREYPLWDFNNESSGVLSNGGDIAMINALIHQAMHDPAVRADLLRHGYVTEKQMNDILLMFPDEFTEGTDGKFHVEPETE